MSPAELLAWRQRLQRNKMEAAKLLGCSRTAYHQWETGRSEIPRYVALACSALSHGLPPMGRGDER